MPSSVFVTGGQIEMEGTLETGLVRPDGDLSVAILRFPYELDGVRASYAGSVNNALTDDAWNYVFLDEDGVLTINTTGFPSETHLRLARMRTQDGGIVARDDERIILTAAIDKNVGSDASEGQSSTSLTDWQQKLRVSKDLEDGEYLVWWYCELQHSNTTASEYAEMRVTVNDTTEIGYSYWPYTNWMASGGFGRAVLSAGSFNFDLDFRAQGGGTAYIRRVRLFTLRIK